MRRLVRSNPFLYRIYIRLIGSTPLPHPPAKVFITGIGRSGITFAGWLFRELFPDQPFASHFHTIASLKTARKKGIPTVVLIRNPLDCAASAVVKNISAGRGNEDTNIDRAINDYIDYYSYVEKNRDDFTVVGFKTVTQSPDRFIGVLADLKIVEEYPKQAVLSAAERVLNRLRDTDKRPPEQRMVPNARKENTKDAIKQKISRHPALAEATKLFESLCDSSEEETN